MPSFDQLPAKLNLAFVRGDQFDATFTFNVDLTGYAVAGDIVSTVDGTIALALPLTVSSPPSAGVVVLSLSELQTGSLAAGTYTWRLRWTGPGEVARTVLDGYVEAKS